MASKTLKDFVLEQSGSTDDGFVLSVIDDDFRKVFTSDFGGGGGGGDLPYASTSVPGKVVLADDAKTIAGTNDSDPVVPKGLQAKFDDLFSGTLEMTGVLDINGSSYTKPYDTALWIAPPVKTAPGAATQAGYLQHRISGDASASVHDALASELRLSGITNATYLNAFEASIVVTGGANTIPDVRAGTFNLHTSGTPSGSITSASILHSQTIPTLGGTLTIDDVYGLYIDQQVVGTRNWGAYIEGTQPSQIEGQLRLGRDNANLTGHAVLNGATSTFRRMTFQTAGVDRWWIHANTTTESGSNLGSDLQIVSRTDAGASNVTALTISRQTGRATFGGFGIFMSSTSGGVFEMVEQGSAPANAAANSVRIFAVDNGAGKTQLMARFATGAAVQIAIEP